MSEATADNTQPAAEPHGEATDWEAKYREALEQSRKWEARSKANADKAKAYDAAQKGAEEGQKAASDAVERAEKAEAELAQLRAEKARAGIVAEVAAEKKVDPALLALMRGETREEVEKAADALSKAVAAAPIYPGVPDPGKGAGAKAEPGDFSEIKNPAKRVMARAESFALNEQR